MRCGRAKNQQKRLVQKRQKDQQSIGQKKVLVTNRLGTQPVSQSMGTVTVLGFGWETGDRKAML